MKNSEYQIIIKNINDQINECSAALSEYNMCLRDFTKMTMENINATILSCRKVNGLMDKFVKDDLYHIIGMGNLNAAQLSHIVRLTKTLLKYRTDIKFFAVQSTITVPKRKECSTYNLSSGVKLVNKKGKSL